jgi:phthiocerol/phenolphthiocerol synthesis type-I polyketide synthase B
VKTAFSRIADMTGEQRTVLADKFGNAARISVAEPVAVVGIGCRFPGGVDGPASMWRLLIDGVDAVTQVPADRWDADAFFDPDPLAPGRMTTRCGGFVPDVTGFDADFFGIAPREAQSMDPQQRMLLEVTWEALENAGIPPDTLGDTRTGVMMGVYYNEYQALSARTAEMVNAYTGTGNAHSVTVGRISYLLGLRGPAVAVDTACSSSLVSVHLACQSLRLRETDLALAGGVSVILRPETQIAISAWGLLSPQGRCKTFDAGADGFVRGEGCGVVVLKRLVDAVRDGDHVLAVIRGSAVNQDGRSNGVTAPNALAQRDVITDALRSGDITADSVHYVEAHGTGTVLGDPIEFEALAETYGAGTEPCALGAAKTNFGHLEAAAGVLGLIKATLAVQSGQIPPNLHFSQWNPAIDPEPTRFFLPTETTPWPTQDGPRRAAVSSFGLGGTNAHVVLEQGPEPAAKAAGPTDGVTTLVVGGRSVARVAAMADVLAQWLTGDGAGVPLAAVAHALNHHRSRPSRFGTVCARDSAAAVAGLRALAAGLPGAGVVPARDGACGPGTVFVYSGQGSQWAGMGRQLLADEPVFAAAVAELEPLFFDALGFSLQEVLAGGQPVAGDVQVQSVLVGLQLALTALWRSYGVEPDAVIGHSVGEVTAAVVSGALTPAQGLRVVAVRSRLMARLTGTGAVALVELDTESTQALIADYPQLSITVFASPRQTVVAGPVDQVDALLQRARERNIFARRVNMEVPSHHALMESVLPELRSGLADLVPAKPQLPVISTVLENADHATLFDAQYWAANVRNPVRFRQAIETASQAHSTFVEISPHPVLTKSISDTIGDVDHHSIGTLVRDGDDTVSFHTNLNATHTARPPRTEHPPEPHPALPSTPWQHRQFWISAEPPPVAPLAVTAGAALDVPAGTEAAFPADWLYEPTWPASQAPSGGTAGDAEWLVFADDDLGAELVRALGSRASVLAPSVVETAAESDLDTLRAAVGSCEYVLYAPSLPAGITDVAAAYRVFHGAKRVATALADLAQTGAPARLFVLTRNAQPVAEGDRANPVHAALWGFGRTLALEHPEIWGGIVDLDDTVPAVLAAGYLLAEAGADDAEDQVVYRAGVRHVPRLQRRRLAAAAQAPEGVCGADTSHLVIGATGNIGPQLIGQLADMGAKTIVAVSRRPGTRLAELTGSLQARGVTLVEVAADVTDETAMTALFDRFGTDLPALEGIYLAAFAGNPVTLVHMTDADVAAMFRPKLDAVALLHRLSLRTTVVTPPLRHFVLFSSISGLLGSRWLGHYTATSTFLDTFAYARRAIGLPATVVNWGLWHSLAEVQADARQVSADTGMVPMADEVAIRALAVVMAPGAPARSTVVAADWPLLAAAYRTRGALRILDDLLVTDADGLPGQNQPESEFRMALRESEPEHRFGMLAGQVNALASAVMGLSAGDPLDPAAGFFQLGMDSLMCVTLARSLSETLGEALPPAVIFDYPTVDALTDHLATVLPELAGSHGGDGQAAAIEDDYDDLSEDDLLKQLSDRLG